MLIIGIFIRYRWILNTFQSFILITSFGLITCSCIIVGDLVQKVGEPLAAHLHSNISLPL